MPTKKIPESVKERRIHDCRDMWRMLLILIKSNRVL